MGILYASGWLNLAVKDKWDVLRQKQLEKVGEISCRILTWAGNMNIDFKLKT